MKRTSFKHYLPYPEEDSEVALNIIAELRADSWYWQKREWYLKEKAKQHASNSFLMRFYENLSLRVKRIRIEIYTEMSDMFNELTVIPEIEQKLFKELQDLSDEIINKDSRRNEKLEIPNQPFPLPFKLDYK